MIKHWHHIIPVYMGGTDDPSNLVELTVEEHAEAHRKLFEQYGNLEDKVAWKALSGTIGKEEFFHDLAVIAGRKSGVKNRERVVNGTHHLLGGEIQRKHVASGKHHLLGGEIQRKIVADGKHHFLGGNIQRKNSRKRVEEGTHIFQKVVTCPYCNKTGKGGMYRWHFENCKENK